MRRQQRHFLDDVRAVLTVGLLDNIYQIIQSRHAAASTACAHASASCLAVRHCLALALFLDGRIALQVGAMVAFGLYLLDVLLRPDKAVLEVLSVMIEFCDVIWFALLYNQILHALHKLAAVDKRLQLLVCGPSFSTAARRYIVFFRAASIEDESLWRCRYVRFVQTLCLNLEERLFQVSSTIVLACYFSHSWSINRQSNVIAELWSSPRS